MSARIQQIYIALFGRPADPTGLAYWNQVTNNGADLSQMLATLASLPEYTSRFNGLNTVQQVNSIFNALFGRDADLAGLTYFAGQIQAGNLTLSTLAVNILDGAQGTDAQIVANKVTAATNFTAALDTGAEILAYSGNAGITAGTSFLNGITTDATSIPNATATAAAITTLTQSNSGGTPGQTFTLTTGTDNVTGTANNDTIAGLVSATAGQSTLSSSDVIAGGSGTDTLEITVDVGVGLNSVPVASVSGIENISIRNVSGNNQTIDGSNFTGETAFIIDRSTSAVVVNNIGTADVTIKGNSGVDVGDATLTVGGTTSVTDAFTLNVDGGTTDGAASNFYVNDTLADWTAATINSTGAANTLDDVNLSGLQADATTHTITGLTIAAASNLTINTLTGFAANATITVTGAGRVDLDANALPTNVDTIEASGSTGGVRVALDTETDTKFTGGSGEDWVTAGNVAYVAANTAAINGGAGTADRLVVGNGNALSSSASGAKFTNFEVLEVNTNATIDLDNIAGITSLVVDNATGVDLNDVSAAQAGAVTVQQSVAVGSVIDIAVKGAATVGQLDTLKITVDDGASTTGNVSLGVLTSAAVESLEVTANENTFITGLTSMADVTSVTVAGSKAVNLTTGALASNINTAVNASSATGVFTFDADASTANGFAVTGGSGNDVFAMSDNDLADRVIGGDGDDIIYANGAVNEIQQITFSAATGGVASAITITIGGVTVTTGVLANNAANTVVGAAALAALQANAELNALGYSFAAGGTADIVVATAPASAGDIAAATFNVGTLTMVAPAVGGGATVNGGTSEDNVAADVLTGGAGNDTFFVGEGGALTVIDTITDLNLGDNTAGGTVDLLSFGGIGAATAEAVVSLSTAQQAAVTAAADFATGVNLVFGTAGVLGNVSQFTYGTDTYIAVNGDGNGTYNAGADIVIKVTGVTGTLDVNDFVFTV